MAQTLKASVDCKVDASTYKILVQAHTPCAVHTCGFLSERITDVIEITVVSVDVGRAMC